VPRQLPAFPRSLLRVCRAVIPAAIKSLKGAIVNADGWWRLWATHNGGGIVSVH
jgi:hypothetical protein